MKKFYAGKCDIYSKQQINITFIKKVSMRSALDTSLKTAMIAT